MDQTLKMKMQRLGELLAESPLADEVKNVIVENAEKLTPTHVDALIRSLERERVELEALEREVRELTITEREAETNLEQKQKDIAREQVNTFLAKILKENLQRTSS